MPSLDALLRCGVDVAAVVTNPDRPAGRGMTPRPSPVKASATEVGLPVLQPESARDAELAATLGGLRLDVGVVVAYGKILPPEVLALPRRGLVNVHFSQLPAYRGAAPVQRAIIEGATETGVSLMVLTEGMDEGPVVAATPVPIRPDDTAGSLGERLAAEGANLLTENLAPYVAGDIAPAEQDPAAATYAPKVAPEEGKIDWTRSAVEIRNLVRGLNPAPGAWTTLRGQRIKVHGVEIAGDGTPLSPGEAVSTSEGLMVGSGDVPVRLVEVQAAGKRRMNGPEFARGLRLEPEERLG